MGCNVTYLVDRKASTSSDLKMFADGASSADLGSIFLWANPWLVTLHFWLLNITYFIIIT